MTKQEFEEMTWFKLLGKDQMLIMEFISYWTETGLKGKKMRFEGEKYFDINYITLDSLVGDHVQYLVNKNSLILMMLKMLHSPCSMLSV